MSAVRLAAVAAAMVVVLGGCTSAGNLRQADVERASGEREAHAYIERMRQAQPLPSVRPTVSTSNDQWVDTRPMRMAGRRLPAALDCSVSFKPGPAMDLLQFAQQITQDCKVAVRVTPDALAVVNGTMGEGGGNSGAPAAGVVLPELPRLPSLRSGMAITPATTVSVSSPIPPGGTLSGIADYVGPVGGLLDLVATRNGLSWRYNESTHSVSIFYLDTRTYRIDAFPTVTNMQSTIQTGTTTSAGTGGTAGGSMGGGASGGGGMTGMAGSSQTTSTTMTSSLYADMETTIKSFLTPQVGRLAISASTGSVSVTDTPEVLDRIGQLLDRENEQLTKQIIFHTRILSVSTDTSDEIGINWDLMYQSLSNKIGLSFNTPFQPASNAGTLGASVINTGQFQGSNAVLSALSSLGNVRTITSPTSTTLNLRPAPVQIARQIGYIAQAQAPIQNGTNGTLTPGGLTPGYVTAGFNMSLVPRLLEDGLDMILQYSISITALNQMRSVSAAGTMIEFPDIDQRMFSNEVQLRSGETLILHGFEQDTSNNNRQGMGSPFAWMLGGSAKSGHSRQAIVILITAEVVNRRTVASAQ